MQTLQNQSVVLLSRACAGDPHECIVYVSLMRLNLSCAYHIQLTHHGLMHTVHTCVPRSWGVPTHRLVTS